MPPRGERRGILLEERKKKERRKKERRKGEEEGKGLSFFSPYVSVTTWVSVKWILRDGEGLDSRPRRSPRRKGDNVCTNPTR